jgi:hypothetical protein
VPPNIATHSGFRQSFSLGRNFYDERTVVRQTFRPGTMVVGADRRSPFHKLRVGKRMINSEPVAGFLEKPSPFSFIIVRIAP